MNAQASEQQNHIHDYCMPVTTTQTVEQPCGDHSYAAAPPTVAKAKKASPSLVYGYRFNIDNLDYSIQVRDMTMSNQNREKHYVQVLIMITN